MIFPFWTKLQKQMALLKQIYWCDNIFFNQCDLNKIKADMEKGSF